LTTAEAAPAPLDEELRRYLGHVSGAEPGSFELSWRGLPSSDTLAPAVEDPERFLRPTAEVVESHAPELLPTTPTMRGETEVARTGPASGVEHAMSSTVDRAMAAIKAEGAELALRLEAAEQAAAGRTQRVNELEQELATVLRTAEYLETQRAALAEELQEAWAAHERNERARLDGEAALLAANASQGVEMAAANAEMDRLGRRLREIESVHAESLALNAALRIEVERQRAQLDEARAATDADRVTLASQASTLDDARAERARVGDTLKSALTDFEDLSSWARAKCARLSEALQNERGTGGR
jgi:chromosome segregation ATPase